MVPGRPLPPILGGLYGVGRRQNVSHGLVCHFLDVARRSIPSRRCGLLIAIIVMMVNAWFCWLEEKTVLHCLGKTR